MSAEYDVHAETESEDGGVSLAKVEFDDMEVDTGSDTTPTSQDSGESSSSFPSAWGETLASSFDQFIAHGDHITQHQHTPSSLNEIFPDSMDPSFDVPQAALSTTSSLMSEAPQNLETNSTVVDAEIGTLGQVQYLPSTDGDSHEGWSDHQSGPANNLLLPIGIQMSNSLNTHFWPGTFLPQASTDPLPTATDDIIPTEHPESPVGISEDQTIQGTSQDLLQDQPVLAGLNHTDGSDEEWLAMSEDSNDIFSSDIAHETATLPSLSQASNMAAYYDDDGLEEENSFFSVSFFLYHWKRMYATHKPDYPPISSLANPIERAKIRRPDKVTRNDGEPCDYQGIHWSRFQTTRQEARQVRRMTYRNLRNLGPPEQDFGTKAFKAKFPGLVLPNSDRFFSFNEMDTKRRPDYAHFQLRHNLSATSKNAVFYNYRPPRLDAGSVWDAWNLQNKTIVCFNPESGTELCAMNVNKKYSKEDPKISKIHTMTAGNGVLAAGSFEGVYAMKSLSADFESAPIVGSIATGNDVSTNHIHTLLDRQSGLPRVVFDSNDKTVRILDCTTSNWVACHKYPYQVNCSATSPDGRLRLLNGDDCEPIVANAETGEVLAKLPGHNDFGFACDWAPDGITMATGHQDGLVQVWDARKMSQSLVSIAMEQAGCRSLQFSPLGSGKRVLVLAEPADFVHIVDVQTLESKQTIDFFGEISGISMPPDGSKLYIANADARYGGLMEFERSWDPKHYNQQPFRVRELEDEHEEMVDLIVDAKRFPRYGTETFAEHVEPLIHRQGLSFMPFMVIEGRIIHCDTLFAECLSRGGGQRVTASGDWSAVARTLTSPALSPEKAASCGQQLHEYWLDNLAPYETTRLYAQMYLEYQRFLKRRTGSGKPYPDEERQYRRDRNDARREDFKIGRKSKSLDWLSESEMRDDPRVIFPRDQLGRQRASRSGVYDTMVYG